MFNKNWKTNTAFLVFIAMYIYSVVTKMEVEKISTVGYISMFSTFAMMIRSEALTTILTNMSEKFKDK